MTKQCPKCKGWHGNDWSQCNGDCPMSMSPHYRGKGNKIMNAFWWAKTGDKAGMYAIGLGNVEVILITAPDDALGAQWTQCCAYALNARERDLRTKAVIEAGYMGYSRPEE